MGPFYYTMPHIASYSAGQAPHLPDHEIAHYTKATWKLNLRAMFCKARVPPAVERFPLEGGTPALHLKSPKVSCVWYNLNHRNMFHVPLQIWRFWAWKALAVSSRRLFLISQVSFIQTIAIRLLIALLTLGGSFPIQSAVGQVDPSEREKPVKAHVKIFNASYRNGVELWETGLDLDFRDQRLATDVRVGEGGLVRTIEFTSKDTVDVRRHPQFLQNKRQVPSTPAASLGTAFSKGSVTLLVVHGNLGRDGEKLQIDAIREFPVPDFAKRLGLARFVVWNFRPGNSILLAIGELPPIELGYRESREVYLNPQETEIFLIHKAPGQLELRRQLAVFKFVANRNYTGIISPASEIPDRPLLRISDSNEQWESISTPPVEKQPQ